MNSCTDVEGEIASADATSSTVVGRRFSILVVGAAISSVVNIAGSFINVFRGMLVNLFLLSELLSRTSLYLAC